jgi:hypothetical protein
VGHRSHARGCGHEYGFRQGFDAEALHDARPMQFNGARTYSEFPTDNLVGSASQQTLQDLTPLPIAFLLLRPAREAPMSNQNAVASS